ncbi:MAG: EF-hand domain-containing protein [Planctomycetaceae bacterium]
MCKPKTTSFISFALSFSFTICVAQVRNSESDAVSSEAGQPSEAFSVRDTDKDGLLTVDELLAGGGQKEEALKRDFKVFDADHDGQLSELEFRTIPALTPRSQRNPVFDPVVALAAAKKTELFEQWSKWDQDSDDTLSLEEFEASKINTHVKGLQNTDFTVWDRDADGRVSRDDIDQLLEIAFGIRSPTGQFLRNAEGSIIDWRMFRGLNPDENGRVPREEYIKRLGSVEAAKKMFPTVSDSDDPKFDVTEFFKSGHHTEPVNLFLTMDTNFDGNLSEAELESLPAWGPPGKNWLTGFDDDHDGAYSLREFQLTPQVNLLATWHAARDENGDGKLSLEEFRFMEVPVLAALAAEYFHRLDIDNNNSLILDEWPFTTNHPDAKFQFLDTNKDGSLSIEEFLAEGSLPMPRLQRDFKVFDVDGDSKLTRSEFSSIPHWNPEEFRTSAIDPIVQLARAAHSIVDDNWDQWDSDGDGSLTAAEFMAASPGSKVSGMESLKFADWDIGGDGKISMEDAALAIDVAFGVRAMTGEILRSNSGEVADWTFFRNVDADKDGLVTLNEYLAVMKHRPDAEAMFQRIAGKSRDSFDGSKFVKGPHRTGPVPHFLALDKDLSGELSADELSQVMWGPKEKRWLPGFDDDGSGAYSLIEFLRIPHINILVQWQAAIDSNNDGVLSLDEFRFAPVPAYSAVSAEYFRRLDQNQDQSLSLDEWSFRTLNPVAKFSALDANTDGLLVEAEFLAEASLPQDRLRRDFHVFDADANGEMTLSEFQSIPHRVPENMREVIPDPVIILAETATSEIVRNWSDWDTDADGLLDMGEFAIASLPRKVAGLEMTSFGDWDRDDDQKVSIEDVRRMLDVSFGVRSPTGELLRSDAGHVVDWRGFMGLKPNADGKVSRDAYLKNRKDPERWFPKIFDADHEWFGVTEYLTSGHKTDPVQQFLNMDVNLDGQLDPVEMEALPPWGPPGKNWLPGFDDDGNGAYSLREFRLIPQINLLTTWHAARDTDNDGKLSPLEFRFMPPPALASLSLEYFRRLDSDKDGFLTLSEWPFTFDFARVPREVVIQLRDRNGDRSLSFEEVLGELKRAEPGDEIDVNHEAALARREEAFLKADTNADGVLDRKELATEDGFEAVAPGSSGLSRRLGGSVTIPAAGAEDSAMLTYLIIEINILLVIGVAVYLYRKQKR